ncbi:unnamed protein product [Hymenolepis diminuta]|uniref:Uncharacterized protein n=1 Tax=Hymenolepis diminuta TaxID=6216 RepID=A0A564XWP3_HYMDI|nr:unnamed protein product [Hymenolepis diminuta]
MSAILLLRGKLAKNKQPKSTDLNELSAENIEKWKNSISLPQTFLRGDGIIEWNLASAEYTNVIVLDLNTFAIFLNGEFVRNAQYQIINLKSGEHQIILRISFATVLEADNIRRVIEIKANINSDLHLCLKSFTSEFLTPEKLVNLISLGLSLDHWFLSSSTLL